MTDYEVVVSSSAIQVETDEEGSAVSAIWLGNVDMVLLMVWVKGVVRDKPWRVDGGCGYVSF